MGAARVQADAIADAPSHQFADRQMALLSNQIVERDLDRAIDAARFRVVARTLLEQNAQRIGIADGAAGQKRRDEQIDDLLGCRVWRGGSIAEESGIGRDPDQHGIPLGDLVVRGRTREQVCFDTGDLHLSRRPLQFYKRRTRRRFNPAGRRDRGRRLPSLRRDSGRAWEAEPDR